MFDFRNLQGKVVIKLFVIMWSPWGEEYESQIDISFGFVFDDEPNQICLIRVDKDDLWEPHIKFEVIPDKALKWEDFCHDKLQWMQATDDTNLIVGYEYYDVSNCELFSQIINKEIQSVELLYLEGISAPFGVKINFISDHIISLPNTDGNSIETLQFKCGENFERFNNMGVVNIKRINL